MNATFIFCVPLRYHKQILQVNLRVWLVALGCCCLCLRLKIALKLGLGTCLDILNVAEYSYFDAPILVKVLCMSSSSLFMFLFTAVLIP